MEYRKVYCHYNFTVEMKNKDEECWTSRLYFAETKLMHGVKYYFCTPLEATDDGMCSCLFLLKLYCSNNTVLMACSFII